MRSYPRWMTRGIRFGQALCYCQAQMAIYALAFICLSLGWIVWRLQTQKAALATELQQSREQTATLQQQLEEAALRIAELETTRPSADGLLERVVQGLVALGIPGLILLVAVATSGFAGAAAITSALAALGGPLGMIGGIGVLILLALASKALAQYGLPKIAMLVVKGLITSGNSPQKILERVAEYPSWIVSTELRRSIEDVLRKNS